MSTLSRQAALVRLARLPGEKLIQRRNAGMVRLLRVSMAIALAQGLVLLFSPLVMKMIPGGGQAAFAETGAVPTAGLELLTGHSFVVNETNDEGTFGYTVEISSQLSYLMKPDDDVMYTSGGFSFTDAMIDITNLQHPEETTFITKIDRGEALADIEVVFTLYTEIDGEQVQTGSVTLTSSVSANIHPGIRAEYRAGDRVFPVFSYDPHVPLSSSKNPFGFWTEDDIFNAGFQLSLVRLTHQLSDYELSLIHEPAADTEVRIFFVWGGLGETAVTYCPVDWETSDETGAVSFSTGGGGSIDLPDGELNARELYVGIRTGNDTRWLQYNRYPGLNDFDGTLAVTVRDLNGNPVPDLVVRPMGGVAAMTAAFETTGQEGKAAVTVSAPGVSPGSDHKEIEMTWYPRIGTHRMPWTQIVDYPSFIVEDHRASPLFLSPEIGVWRDTFYQNAVEAVGGLWLEAYAVDDPEGVIGRTEKRTYKVLEEYTPSEKQAGRHRAYLEIEPSVARAKRLGLRHLVEVTDPESLPVTRKLSLPGNVQTEDSFEDWSHRFRKPKKKNEFFILFVPLRVGAWSNMDESTANWGDIHNPRQIRRQVDFARRIFPVEVNYHIWPLSLAINRNLGGYIYNEFYYAKIIAELVKIQKRSRRVDLVVGIAPPGFLGATGLAQDFVTGAVLFDPDAASRGAMGLRHTVVHEFLHTQGYYDEYRDESSGLRPLSADGYDATASTLSQRVRINHEEPDGMKYSYGNRVYEAVMYDHAPDAWPTREEYRTILLYTTESEGTGAASPLAANGDGRVLLLSGDIVHGGLSSPADGTRVFLDPVFSYTGDVNLGVAEEEANYTVRIVDSAGNVLDRAHIAGSAGFQGSIPVKPFDEDANGFRFMVSLPDHPDKAAVEIWSHNGGAPGELLERYEYSNNVPVVDFSGPASTTLSGEFSLDWQALDGDGGRLFSSVYISSDDGETWESVSLNIPHAGPGSYSLTLNAEVFPAGDEYRFKVALSDGLHETEAVSDRAYRIEGYAVKPVMVVGEPERTVAVTPGDREAAAYLPVANSGNGKLTVRFDPESLPEWVAPSLAHREFSLYGEDETLVRIPLIPPAGAPGESLEADLTLLSNDPESPAAMVTLKMEYAENRPAPELFFLHTMPEDISSKALPLYTVLDMTAIARGGRGDLQVAVTIEAPGGQRIVDEEPMLACGLEPGAYYFNWRPDPGEVSLAAGEYGVRISMKDPETALERAPGGYDFAFTLMEPNNPPDIDITHVFPVMGRFRIGDNHVLNVTTGDEMAIHYTVSDPDGDALEVHVVSNLQEKGLQHTPGGGGGTITWTANLDGTHSLYLVAEDVYGNRSQVYFMIDCEAAEDEDPGADPPPALPPPPILETGPEIVDGGSIVIEGTAPPNALIRITVLGQFDTEPLVVTGSADPQGRFAIEIPLAPGENTILVTSQAEGEDESLQAVVVITRETQMPPADLLRHVIEVLQILTGAETEHSGPIEEGPPAGLHDAIRALQCIGDMRPCP